MKPTIKDIDAILSFYRTPLTSQDDTVVYALRVLKRLLQEPSEGMNLAPLSRERITELYPDIFKAMRDQLLKEVE